MLSTSPETTKPPPPDRARGHSRYHLSSLRRGAVSRLARPHSRDTGPGPTRFRRPHRPPWRRTSEGWLGARAPSSLTSVVCYPAPGSRGPRCGEHSSIVERTQVNGGLPRVQVVSRPSRARSARSSPTILSTSGLSAAVASRSHSTDRDRLPQRPERDEVVVVAEPHAKDPAPVRREVPGGLPSQRARRARERHQLEGDVLEQVRGLGVRELGDESRAPSRSRRCGGTSPGSSSTARSTSPDDARSPHRLAGEARERVPRPARDSRRCAR